MNENVIFVPNRFNPLNFPQTCPIENFWVNLAQKVNEVDIFTKIDFRGNLFSIHDNEFYTEIKSRKIWVYEFTSIKSQNT